MTRTIVLSLLVVAAPLASAGAAETTPPAPTLSEDNVLVALRSDDPELLQRYIEASGQPSAAFADKLYQTAFQYGCHRRALQALLDAKVPPSPEHFSFAASRSCLNGARAVWRRLSPEDQPKAALLYGHEFAMLVHGADLEKIDELEPMSKLHGETRDALGASCKGGQKSACDAVVSFYDEGKKAFEVLQERVDRYAKGADFTDRACEVLGTIREAQAEIAEERRIGKTAGYVDASRLHQAGAQIEAARAELAELAAGFRAQTGKRLDVAKLRCPRG